MSRVLKTGEPRITQGYSWRHHAVDLVKAPSQLDYITAHSAGKVVFCQTGQVNAKGSTGNKSYGNCVKIDHGNGYATLYAHLSKVYVSLGESVAKGQNIGYMGNTGNSYGAHLHWEVWKDGKRINPTEYLNKDFPSESEPTDILYRVQCGAFGKKENAEKMLEMLKKDGFNGYITTADNGLMRVQVGAFRNKEYAETLSRDLFAKGFDNYIKQNTNIVKSSKEINVGDKIKCNGDTYINGKTIPKWAKASILYVRRIEQGGKVLLVSTEKIKKVYTGRIFANDAIKI